MQDEIEKLVEQFWNGSLTLHENKRLLELIDNESSKLRELDKEVFINELRSNKRYIDSEQGALLLQRLHARIIEENGYNLNSVKKVWTFKAFLKYVAIAAIAIIICSGIGTIFLNTYFKSNRVSSSGENELHEINHPIIQHFSNSSSKPIKFRLPDGSMIELFAHSRMYYDSSFGDSLRNVHVEGGAHIKVAKDKTKPFTVFAGGYGTTALGTQFTVEQKKNKKLVVKLFEGKVVVRKGKEREIVGEGIFLEPGQQLLISEGNKPVVTVLNEIKVNRNRAMAKYRANTTIIFEKEPLPQVFARIKSSFGIRISYNSADLKGLTFSGEIHGAEGVWTEIQAISILNGLKIVKQGEEFIVRKE